MIPPNNTTGETRYYQTREYIITRDLDVLLTAAITGERANNRLTTQPITRLPGDQAQGNFPKASAVAVAVALAQPNPTY